VIVHRDGANDVPGGTGVETALIGGLEEDNISESRTITFYASQTLRLRTIALCYHDFRSWPPKGAQPMDDGEVTISFVVKIPTTDWPLAG
jgi:P-type Ca2+ transporter type 2C